MRNTRLRYRAPRPGFTLVEVLISLVLVLIILMGVNYIFHTASDAVAAGQMLDEFSRDQETAQTVMSSDFRNAARNPPFFEIVSHYCPEYLNQDDAQQTVSEKASGSTGGVGTTSLNNQGQTASMMFTLLNNRNHRADLIRFFATGDYRRTTGDSGQFISGTGSDVAMITYGHGSVPTSSMPWVYFGPVSVDQMSMVANIQAYNWLKPQNYWSSDWAIARNAILLKDPNAITADGEVGYYNRQNWTSSTTGAGIGPTPNYDLPYDPPYTAGGGRYIGVGESYTTNLTPLAYNSPDNQSGATSLQSSRYDLTGVTLEQYRRYVANAYRDYRAVWAYQGGPGGYCGGWNLWWSPIAYNANWHQGHDPSTPAPITNVGLPPTPGVFAPPVWYWHGCPELFCFDVATIYPEQQNMLPCSDLSRFQTDPELNTPLSSSSFAQMTPYLIQHCSQFVVEYAGDYLQQNANGDLTGLGADGQIDFIVDPNGNKRIRWYGAPRSTHNNLLHTLVNKIPSTGATTAYIRGYDDGTGATTITNAVNGDNYAKPGLLNDYSDVIPLGDYYSLYLHLLNSLSTQSSPPPNAWNQPNYQVNTAGASGSINYPIYTSGYVNASPPGNYAGNVPSAGYAHPIWEYQDFETFSDYGLGMPNRSPNYIAVWRNDAPMLVRILIKVDEPNDKVKSGPWYEYVFRIK